MEFNIICVSEYIGNWQADMFQGDLEELDVALRRARQVKKAKTQLEKRVVALRSAKKQKLAEIHDHIR